MSDYLFLAASLWAASGVVPVIIFERWLTCRYGDRPDIGSAYRLFVAWFVGPLAFAAVAVVMNALMEDDE